MTTTLVPLEALAEGLTAALEVPAITSLAPGGVVNELPDDPTLPIVRVVVRGKPVGAIGASTSWECDVEVDVYSSYRGDRECQRIAAAIVARLDQQRPPVTGWDVVVCAVQDLYPIPDELVNGVPVARWTVPFLVLLATPSESPRPPSWVQEGWIQ